MYKEYDNCDEPELTLHSVSFDAVKYAQTAAEHDPYPRSIRQGCIPCLSDGKLAEHHTRLVEGGTETLQAYGMYDGKAVH